MGTWRQTIRLSCSSASTLLTPTPKINRSGEARCLETELMHFCSVQTSKVIGGTWRPYPPLPMAPSPASAQRPGQRQPPTTPSLQASPAVAAAAKAAASVQSSQRPSPRPDMSQVSPAARPASGAQQPTVNGVLMGQAQAQADARWQLKERAESARAKWSLRSKSLRRSNGRRRSTLNPSHRRSNVYDETWSHLRELLRHTLSEGSVCS
jgi:hypothetical protein